MLEAASAHQMQKRLTLGPITQTHSKNIIFSHKVENKKKHTSYLHFMIRTILLDLSWQYHWK